MERIELLAPARDLQTGRVAISCGADAVYIGAPQFGARQAAGNSVADIEALAASAHRYWARVYATLNTLLTDAELDAAVALAHQLHAAGVDALIIQDVGLLECDLPPLPLIASTQMHNHSAARVAFLEQVGFQRAILARELSLEEIAAIRAATRLELEVFVHGALCVGYSGQCYLSYALGGRSGNRGQCAQPCRRPYLLQDESGRTLAAPPHLLSLQDLNLTAHLQALLDTGITSFKVEGRLKGPDYVANVVGHYRRELDAVLGSTQRRPASSGTVQLGFHPDPRKTFHRGYTTYFLQGRSPEMAAKMGSLRTPKHLGEPVGRVAALFPDSFVLDGPVALHNGDGLSFFDADGQLQGTVVNRVAGPRVYPARRAGLQPGTEVFRNHDHAFQQALATARTQRRIAIRLRLESAADGLRLVAVDEDGVQAEAALAGPVAPARDADTARASLERQLQRCGDSEFACTQVRLDLPVPCFLPLAAVNDLRRRALDSLTVARAAARPRWRATRECNAAPSGTTTLGFEGNVINTRAAAFYRRHGVSTIQPGAETGRDLRGQRVMTTRYCLRQELDLCPRAARNLAAAAPPLFLTDTDGRRLRLCFSCDHCGMEVYLEGGAATHTG